MQVSTEITHVIRVEVGRFFADVEVLLPDGRMGRNVVAEEQVLECDSSEVQLTRVREVSF